MTGPVPNNQDEPQDPIAWRHQMLLLKSAHCCRPVVYQGLHKFIHGLTLNQGGGQLDMVVYLAGVAGGIDWREIDIATLGREGGEA